MKKYISLFISLMISLSSSNCSTSKSKNAPINDYLTSLDLKNKKIMIIQEKINNNITIGFFKGETLYSTESKTTIKAYGVEEPIYNEALWENMKKKYEDLNHPDYWIKGNYWTKNDFKHNDITFIKLEKFPNPGKYEEFDFKELLDVFSFSEVIYYNNKKYAVFTLQKTNTDDKLLGNASILLMEKINRKWKVVQEVDDEIYN
ncbi:hypothetical protein [Flavobacterium sp. RS13.1]|uniref:hypothetical protein n=1 Tax=Flavobacterium sp. RS13.1 TaxID=3400345 RepID=UPI003AAC4DFB